MPKVTWQLQAQEHRKPQVERGGNLRWIIVAESPKDFFTEDKGLG